MVAITARNALAKAHRVIIKVGSALLVDEGKNTINTHWLAGIAQEISRLKVAGKDVVVVSSGAIALGTSDKVFMLSNCLLYTSPSPRD